MTWDVKICVETSAADREHPWAPIHHVYTYVIHNRKRSTHFSHALFESEDIVCHSCKSRYTPYITIYIYMSISLHSGVIFLCLGVKHDSWSQLPGPCFGGTSLFWVSDMIPGHSCPALFWSNLTVLGVRHNSWSQLPGPFFDPTSLLDCRWAWLVCTQF